MTDRLQHLNPAQRDAVMTMSKPLLILAGAGTGKTRVITHRIAELIRYGVPPDRILSVTFTNKAATEMLERTTALLGKRGQPKPFISTFHSLCVRILRTEIEQLGYPRSFVIYDRGDQESAARTALRDIRVGEKSMKPGDLLGHISRWKTIGAAPDLAREIAQDDAEFIAATAYRRYQQNLRSCGAVDFDDLMLLTLQLFREFPDVLARQQARFDHVQIDEYQDTNGLQFQLIESLVRPHKNLCVVGDDDQSIYGWRGAEVKHILGFQSIFPGAKVIRLEDNYRCTDQILTLANQLVRHNRGRHDKTLRPHKKGDPVRFAVFPDEKKEAEQVVQDIAYRIQELEVSPSDFAILFRTNEQPRLFESELRRKRLPYVIIGATSFYDRREIRDILGYLKFLSQPADEMSLLRIINTPARGIGASTVEKIVARSVRQKLRFWDALPGAIQDQEVPKGAASALEQFRDLLDRYRARIEAHPEKLPAIINSLIEEIDYESEINKQYKDPSQQMMRLESVHQIVESLDLYVKRADHPSLSGFIDESALSGRDSEPDKKDGQLAREGIKLMTLHSAKGLEFPHVYLVGMEEGILPHHRSLLDNEASVDEERRLAYVGITRARENLTLSRAASRMKWGKRRDSHPSRFLFEMRGGKQLPSAPPSESPPEGANVKEAEECLE